MNTTPTDASVYPYLIECRDVAHLGWGAFDYALRLARHGKQVRNARGRYDLVVRCEMPAPDATHAIVQHPDMPAGYLGTVGEFDCFDAPPASAP